VRGFSKDIRCPNSPGDDSSPSGGKGWPARKKEEAESDNPNDNRAVVPGDKIDSRMCGASMAPNKSSK